MSVHVDGRPTISDPRSNAALEVAIGKPMLVEDAIARDVSGDPLFEMHYGAWRALKSVREAVEQSKAVVTAADVLVIVSSLESTYEDLCRV